MTQTTGLVRSELVISKILIDSNKFQINVNEDTKFSVIHINLYGK